MMNFIGMQLMHCECAFVLVLPFLTPTQATIQGNS